VDGTRLDDRRHHHGVTIVGLPWARAAFSIAAYTLLPFGYKAVPRDEYFGREDVGTGPLGVIGNVVWLVFAGWWLALGHLVTAILLAVTIVGFPFAWAHLSSPGWRCGRSGRRSCRRRTRRSNGRRIAKACRQHQLQVPSSKAAACCYTGMLQLRCLA